MRLASRSVLFVLCVLAPLVAAAQNSDVDWVRGTDFGSFHSFTWATHPNAIQDPDPAILLASAIQTELEAKGVQHVRQDGKFDLFVAYNGIVNPDPADMSRKTVTLKVLIFDARNNTVIWRAGGHFAVGSDREENRSRARALLAEMFRQYPPE